jgi:hypothetical protein
MILPLGLRLDNMRSSDDHESLCIMEALSRSQNSGASSCEPSLWVCVSLDGLKLLHVLRYGLGELCSRS